MRLFSLRGSPRHKPKGVIFFFSGFNVVDYNFNFNGANTIEREKNRKRNWLKPFIFQYKEDFYEDINEDVYCYEVREVEKVGNSLAVQN
jgi:hypothetical protein